MPLAAVWARMPFSARLLTTASFALLVAGVVMIVLSARQEARHARVDLATTLQQELETLPQALAEIVVIGDFSTLQQTLDRYVARPLLIEVRYRDTSGVELASLDVDQERRVPAWFLDFFGGDTVQSDVPVVVGGRVYGTLYLTLSPLQPAERAWQRLQAHLAVLLLAIVLDFAGIWLVLRNGLRPLRRLEQAVDALAQGELDTRLAPKGSPEIRHLIARFNAMAATLAKTRNALLEESERLVTTLSSIGDGVISVDIDARVNFMNPVAERLTGWSAAEAQGRPLREVFHIVNERTRAEAENPVTRALNEGSISGLANHTLLIARDGSERPIADSAAPIRAHDGRTFGAVLVFRDQSEERRLLDHLRLQSKVFEHALNGIMITDANERIVEVNPAFSLITGYTRAEAIGRTPHLLHSGRHEAAFYARMWEAIRHIGHWRGEIWNKRKDGDLYPEELTVIAIQDEEGQTTHYVGIFRDITDLKAHEAELEHLAYHDPLTDLPNRALLADRMAIALSQMERSEKHLAVCYLDLDGFKPVNDQYGHAIGDRLLRQVAQRLHAALRGGDTVARLGGDEFALLLTDLADRRECEQVLHRLCDTIARPILIGDAQFVLSASIGVAMCPEDARDADTLLRLADHALYEAKEAGRKRYHFYHAGLDAVERQRRAEQDRVRHALAQGEFCLYYQPKVNLHTGEVVGFEALARWIHPERGLISPGEFLPLLHGGDLQLEFGEWAIEQALSQMDAWRAQGIDLPVSVNVTAEHLARSDFVARLKDLLARHPNTPTRRLELEVVESAAIADIAHVADLIESCKQIGVCFALDDFGTGYASLTYLRRLPVGVVKIDQSFVMGLLDDVSDLAIVEGVIGLAAAFRLGIIGEGVETDTHGRKLLELGCVHGQGYGIAHPMPAEEVPRWLARRRGPAH